MAGESGGRVGSGAPRREQDSRDKRIEELQRENAKLIDDLDRTTRDLDRTTRDLDRTTRDLDRTTRYRDRWKRRSEDLKNNSMKPAAPANGRLHPLPSTGRKGPASGPADGPGRSTVGKGPDFARRTSTRSTERRRQGRARTAVGRRSDPRRLAVSGRTSPGPPHRTPLRHRGRSLLAVPPAGAGAPSSRDLRRPWGGRGAARPRPRLARRRVAHRDACAAGQGCRPPADEARPGGHRWRPRSSAASNRPRRRASPTGNSAGKSATRRWSRPTKRAGASASSPTGCGRSSPRSTVYAICPGRGFKDAATVLGTDYGGVVVRDGWRVYRRYKGSLRQSCLNHLLQRCQKLEQKHPHSPWSSMVKAAPDRPRPSGPRNGELTRHGLDSLRGGLEARLDRLIDAPPPLKNAKRFAKHLANEFPAVFLFLRDPSRRHQLAGGTGHPARGGHPQGVRRQPHPQGRRHSAGALDRSAYRPSAPPRPADADGRDVARPRARRSQGLRAPAAARVGGCRPHCRFETRPFPRLPRTIDFSPLLKVTQARATPVVE